MAQQVVTELVIDADTRGADDFSKAMDGAEQASKATLATLSNLNPAIAAAFSGGIVAGAVALLDQVVKLNKELADMNLEARQVGLTLERFQSIRFAGNATGIDNATINSGLEKSASLLNDAQRNVNTLTQLFDSNGLSIRSNNGQLISQNQLLDRSANLIKNAATEQDKIKIAEMLGFTKQWVPLLEQGAEEMNKLAAEARSAGGIISDETIAKADEFSAAWQKSSTLWSTYMKATVAEILPYIDNLIEKASKIDWKGEAKKAFNAVDEKGQLALGGVVAKDTVLNINWTDEGIQAAKDIFNASTRMEVLAKALDAWNGLSFGVGKATPGSDYTEYDNVGAMKNLQAEADAKQDAEQDAADAARGAKTKIPAKDVQADAVDRAIASLEKHTERQLADTKAVGLGDAALARFRAEAAETAAVQANGGKETAAQAAKFKELQDAAASAADTLARAKVAGQIDFGRKSAFLSSDDVAIANQLKGIYGNDIPRALASTEATSLQMNTAMRGISNTLETGLTKSLTDIATHSATAGDAFRNLGLTVVKAMEEMIIKLTIVTPLMRILQSTIGGGGLFKGLFGGSSPAADLAKGVAPMHSGGIVGVEGESPRYIHPSYFDNAPRFHGGGIVGDEVPIIAKRGERVLTIEQQKNMGGSGGDTYVFNNDFRQADSQAVAGIQAQLNQVKKQVSQAPQFSKASRQLRPNAS